MAHLITGYAGVEHIQSEDDGAFNAAFFGNGQYVMESGNEFEGSIVDNNTVRILDGDLLMYGRHVRIKPDTYEDLTISTGTAGTNRIDLICMTYEKNTNDGTESAYLEVIKGAEAEGTAVAPEYTDGNILEGAVKNQMPLYKVGLEGVVLSTIECLFTTIPTYKTLAEKYAAEFKKACETHLDSLGILDTMEEVQANTQEDQLAGALALKELETTLKKSVSDGKTLLAEAITSKKVETASDATFAEMAANIEEIVLGSGNAAKADVLDGKTFTNDDGVEYEGTMPNNGAVSKTIGVNGSYTIPKGYHNGNGKVSQSITNNAGKTVEASAVEQDDDYTYFKIPANAYYSTASKVKTLNSNLVDNLSLVLEEMVGRKTTMTVTVPNNINKGLLIVDVGQGGSKINITADNAITLSNGELELLLYHETFNAASVYGELKIYRVKNISAGSTITITPSAFSSGVANAMSVLLFSA